MKDQITAREFFPNFPEEVFHSWFDYIVAKHSWPPNAEDPNWYGILRRYSPQRWQKSVWAIEKLNVLKIEYHDDSLGIINKMIEAKYAGIVNKCSPYCNNIDSIAQYAKEHHQFPEKVILLEKDNRYDIVDGYRRLSFYFNLVANFNDAKEFINPIQECWVVKIP